MVRRGNRWAGGLDLSDVSTATVQPLSTTRRSRPDHPYSAGMRRSTFAYLLAASSIVLDGAVVAGWYAARELDDRPRARAGHGSC